MRNLSSILILALVMALVAGPAAAQNGREYGKQVNYAEKFYGVVESMPQTGYAGRWIINGKNVQAGANTLIKEKRGKAAVGAYVEVQGQQAGDTFTAYKIEVEESGDMVKSPYPAKFYGTIEKLPEQGREGIWIINGRDVMVTRQTEIEEEHGRVAAGAYVEVKGDYSGRTFTAYEVEVKEASRYRDAGPNRQNADTSRPEFGPSREKPSGRIAPAYAPSHEKAYNILFGGTIERMPENGYDGTWIIEGRNVEVSSKTLIDESGGRASQGAYVKVKGTRKGETITAHEIEIDGKK
ncbi:MAG: hypothetical protein JSU90_06335 [Nitrospiraceae bacterium]|nr:MAG: hypothetical protein JSU90_06335 [Nitrospiraceae bacterium]